MKRLFSTRRGLVVGTAVLGIVSLGVAAFAYWTSSNSAPASATVASGQTWTVSVSPVSTGDLSPNGPSDTIGYTVTTNGTGNQYLSSADISVANADGTPWNPSGSCTAADFSVGGAAAGATYHDTTNSGDIAGNRVLTGQVSLKMVDQQWNQNGCKGVTVPLRVFAS